MRYLAAEKGVNLADVVATGKGGRVVKEDILKHMERTGETIMYSVYPCDVLYVLYMYSIYTYSSIQKSGQALTIRMV